MNDEACKVLFEALAQILSNQQDILRYWSDSRTSDLMSKCNSMAYSFEHND